MRLASKITRIVVKPSWTWVGPVDDPLDRPKPFCFGGHPANEIESLLQPTAVVQRIINRVETCSPIHGKGLVARHTQLHANALEQRFSQFGDSRSPVWRDRLGQG